MNNSESDHLLITGGPGTGKTGILADYAVSMIHTALPCDKRKVLALSFKRHGANDIQQRMNNRLTPEEEDRFESFTIDSFAKELLDRFHHLLPEFWQPEINYSIDEELFEPLTIKDKFYAAAGQIFPTDDIEELPLRDFCYNFMTNSPLPENISWSGKCKNDIGFYMWQYCLKQHPSRLDFPMITALAELLVRLNPQLQALLKSTYCCILADEFQDVTPIHYHFLRSAFSGIRIIAAGDQNQNIMRWAHAMPDNFECFIRDFNAREVQLNVNTRSAAKLLDIQNDISMLTAADSVPVTSGKQTGSAGMCEALLFSTDLEESRFIAEKAAELQNSGIHLRDICVIVRDTPEAYVKMWNGFSDGKTFRFRDESRIQRILTEPVIQILLSLWENAFSGSSNRQPVKYMQKVCAMTEEKALTEISAFCRKLQELFNAQKCTPGNLQKLLELSMAFLDTGKLKALFPRYRHGTWLGKTLTEFTGLMLRDVNGSATVPEVIVNFREGNFIPVTTIRQCKFFEAHTIFFTGWEDQEQWEYSTDENEELCGFLIAASRAKEQLFFTATLERRENDTSIDRIQKIYEVLKNNGISIQLVKPEE